MAATTLPDGNVKTTHGLSFVTTTHTKRGRFVAYSAFDVPDEDYGAGWITGTLAAGELLVALSEERFDLLGILEEASSIPRGDPRRGASAGFLRMIEKMIYFAAEHARHEQIVKETVKGLRASMERARLKEQQEKSAFVQRMKAAKQAKAAQRAQEESHG